MGGFAVSGFSFDGNRYALPSTSATIARTDAAQTFIGNQTFSGQYLSSDGTQSLPGMSFSSEPSSGIYRSGSGIFNLTVLTARVFLLTPSLIGVGPSVQIQFYTAGFSGPAAILTSTLSGNLRHGAVDSAAPVAQTSSVQSVVAGTSNTAGALRRIDLSQSTGNAAGGDLEVWGSPAGTSGTAQNALQRIVKFAANLATTFYGMVTTPASTTSSAGFNIQAGTAPTSPNNGDIWQDGTDLKIQIGGVTKTVTLV